MLVCDEMYEVKNIITKKILSTNSTMLVEALAKVFDLCCKMYSYKVGSYTFYNINQIL